jgi:porin
VGIYLEMATAKAGLWKNGTFFLGLEHHSGGSPSERQTGDFQVLSNIDAPRTNQISEFWYRHAFLDDKLFLKLGKMEANNDFSFITYGLEFINSSAGLIPTIPLPSYPDQDWGAVISFLPAQWFNLNLGIYQGDNNGSRSIGNTIDQRSGPMLIAEPSFKYTLGELPGSFNIGAWWNGRQFDAYHEHGSSREQYGDAWGLYGFLQQLLWKENPASGDCEQGIGLFAQYGWAPKDRSKVTDYVGGGLRWQGAIPTRNDDVLGLGAFHVRFSDKADFQKHSETAIELFYKAQLTSYLAVQPDVQFITNPGGSSNDNAIAVGGRLEFIF